MTEILDDASAVGVKDMTRAGAQKARGWSAGRVVGYLLLAIWGILGVSVVANILYFWNADLFKRLAPHYLSGLLVTLQLVTISMLIGAVLSVPLAYMRMSRNKVVSAFAYGYVYFFRGTPLLAQTFLIYYGSGSFRAELEAVHLWGFFREAWYCAIFAFSLNTAAYQAEILRGAIMSVARGQREAALALGLKGFLVFRHVIFPQALILAVRPYGNEVILMVKGSALVAIITILDLMGETRRAFFATFDFQTYIWAAIIYIAITELIRHIVEWVERRVGKHLK